MGDPKWVARLCLGIDSPCRVWVTKNGEVHLFAHEDAKQFIHFVRGPVDGPSWGAILGNASDARLAVTLEKMSKPTKRKKEKRDGTA